VYHINLQRSLIDRTIDRFAGVSQLLWVCDRDRPETAQEGGLLAYGPRFTEALPQLARQLEKVLRGANPADLPIEQPTRFELVVNLRTAKTIGLDFLPTLLARADEVIE